MYKINLSKDIDYHTQRNNKLVPLEACNMTSLIMTLKANNLPIYFEEKYKVGLSQEEDFATRMMQSEEIHEVMKKIAPWAAREGYPPQQVHSMIEWVVNNKIVGRKIDSFSTSFKLEQVIYNLFIANSASMVSTNFTAYGHIVSVVGAETKQNINDLMTWGEVDLSKVKSIIIDDPYGNYHTGYEDVKGNNIKFTVDELMELVKTPHDNNKWIHLFGI